MSSEASQVLIWHYKHILLVGKFTNTKINEIDGRKEEEKRKKGRKRGRKEERNMGW